MAYDIDHAKHKHISFYSDDKLQGAFCQLDDGTQLR